MYELITTRILKMIDLNAKELDYFLSKLQHIKLKKKELVLKEGQICTHAYFINHGCIRYFYTIDGRENTGQFFFEGSWYADYDSYLSGMPSRQNIGALEETNVLALSKSDLHQLFVEIPKFEKFGRLMAEAAFIGLRKRVEMLTNQSPEERYLNLMKERPHLLKRIPQYYIASYLSIKPPSLSRIRKRMLRP